MTFLLILVVRAAEPVAHLDRGRSPDDLAARVLRAVFNPARIGELLGCTDWTQIATKLVRGFAVTCQEEEWFFVVASPIKRPRPKSFLTR